MQGREAEIVVESRERGGLLRRVESTRETSMGTITSGELSEDASRVSGMRCCSIIWAARAECPKRRAECPKRCARVCNAGRH